MELPSEDSRSQPNLQDSAETDSLSSGERNSQSLEEDIQSSGEKDSLSSGENICSSGQKNSLESQATQATGIPVPQRNTCTTRRRGRSLEDRKRSRSKDDVFFYQQHIGSETHTMEFKRGLDRFKEELLRNACAFLNSKGGQLMYGVDDNGLVLGINISFKRQDQYRLQADEILKRFKPPVLPGEFLMEFLDVEPGVKKISARETPDFKDLKVLRLTFKPPPVLRRLYEIDGTTFRRLQASVQKMTHRDIHEWYAQKRTAGLEQRISQLEQLEQLSNENHKLKSSIREALQTPDNDEARGFLSKALLTN